MPDQLPASRWSRESRLLLLTVAVCAGVLLLLAHLRFPDAPAVDVSAPPLERLAARASYDALAADVQRVEPAIGRSLVTLRVAQRTRTSTFRLEWYWELLSFTLLGVVAAIVSLGFRTVLAVFERWFDARPIPQPLRASLGGLLVGAIATGLPAVVGNGYEPLNNILDKAFRSTVSLCWSSPRS